MALLADFIVPEDSSTRPLCARRVVPAGSLDDHVSATKDHGRLYETPFT